MGNGITIAFTYIGIFVESVNYVWKILPFPVFAILLKSICARAHCPHERVCALAYILIFVFHFVGLVGKFSFRIHYWRGFGDSILILN